MIDTKNMTNIEVQRILRKGMYFNINYNKNEYEFIEFISCEIKYNCMKYYTLECIGKALCNITTLNGKRYKKPVCLGNGNNSNVVRIIDKEFLKESDFEI